MRMIILLLTANAAWAMPEAVTEWLAKPLPERGETPDLGLNREDAEKLRETLAGEKIAALKTERSAEVEAKSITIGDKTMPWLEKVFGEAPEGKRSLWISMHGGGNAPKSLNDQQWKNQITLYKPEEGVYIAPRAPTNTWNLWHEDHIDPLFDRLIADMVACRGVDPDKVYLMGYSAGGDGVWQLAPRMADRFAAASMMAGHPGDMSLLPLRNLPFAIFVGGKDAAYDRNKLGGVKGAELEALHQADPDGYENMVRIYEGLPHWMNLKDAESVPWMAKHTRNPWPKKVIWVQDDRTHDHFYWLGVPEAEAKKAAKMVATVTGNEIVLDGDVPKGTTLGLSDALLDLEKEVIVKTNGKESFRGIVKRTPAAILAGLALRPGASACPVASVTLGE